MKKLFIALLSLLSLSNAQELLEKELDCSLFENISEFEGKYYAKSVSPMGLEEALSLIEHSNATIAIPKSKQENEFLTKLSNVNDDLNATFIGIYDPTYTANYCYEDDKCLFDVSRFVSLAKKPLYFRAFDEKEPNNRPLEQNASDFTKFKGEHYVVIKPNGKWADVGFKERHKVLFEFKSKPNCINEKKE